MRPIRLPGFRLRLRGLLALVGVLALDFGVIRGLMGGIGLKPQVASTPSSEAISRALLLAALPTANVLAVAFLVRRRRGVGAFVSGFLAFGVAAFVAGLGIVFLATEDLLRPYDDGIGDVVGDLFGGDFEPTRLDIAAILSVAAVLYSGPVLIPAVLGGALAWAVREGSRGRSRRARPGEGDTDIVGGADS